MIRRLLRFEFRKLFRQKSFYVCCALLLIFVWLGAGMSALIAQSPDFTDPAPTAPDLLRSALQSANAVLIAGIFTAMFVCADFAEGTLKNICARGCSRTAVCLAKLIAVLTASLLFCGVTWLGGLLAGRALFGPDEGTAAGLAGTLAAQAAVMLGYTGLFFALSVGLRRTGGAIAAGIVAPMLISLLFTTVDTLFRGQGFTLSSYWLEGLFAGLSAAGGGSGGVLTAALLSLGYALLFAGAGCRLGSRIQL